MKKLGQEDMNRKINRRKFVETTACVLGGIGFPGIALAGSNFKPIKFGIITDIHYAETPDNTELNRYYRQSLEKVSECVELMNEQKVDFLIELGDLKDQGNPPKEAETLQFLNTIEKTLKQFKGPLYHVLGNHDHDSISKLQFLKAISNDGFYNAINYYSFTRKSFHFIVLDTNYNALGKEYDHGNFDWTDAHLPDDQLRWLKSDLKLHKKPAIVFVHHQLDSLSVADKRHCPDNANLVRQILEDSGHVAVVFQGHYHKGGLSKINNISYYTLKAVVEGSGPGNNNYAIVEIGEDCIVRIKGFRKTKSEDLYPKLTDKLYLRKTL
jgi:3',5'-cyclic AMP phosphodiesterase CpdA